jgi:hypothetical protein
MFKSIRGLIAAWRGNRTAKPQTYDLEQHHIIALKLLQSEQGWDTLLQLIDNIVAYKAETLLSVRDNATVHRLLGECAALRELPVIVERMVQAQNAASLREENERPDSSIDRRRAALYATPSWGGDH